VLIWIVQSAFWKLKGIWDSFAICKYCLHLNYALLMLSYFYIYFFTEKKAKYVIIPLYEETKQNKTRCFSHTEREKSLELSHPTFRHLPEMLHLETCSMPKV